MLATTAYHGARIFVDGRLASGSPQPFIEAASTSCCVKQGTGDDAVSLRAGRGWIKKS